MRPLIPEKKDYFFNFLKEKVKIEHLERETLGGSKIRGKGLLAKKRLENREEINIWRSSISLNPTLTKSQIQNHKFFLILAEVKKSQDLT